MQAGGDSLQHCCWLEHQLQPAPASMRPSQPHRARCQWEDSPSKPLKPTEHSGSQRRGVKRGVTSSQCCSSMLERSDNCDSGPTLGSAPCAPSVKTSLDYVLVLHVLVPHSSCHVNGRCNLLAFLMSLYCDVIRNAQYVYTLFRLSLLRRPLTELRSLAYTN